MATFSEALRSVIDAGKIDVKELAAKAKLSTMSIHRYLKGPANGGSLPKADALSRIEAAIKLPAFDAIVQKPRGRQAAAKAAKSTVKSAKKSRKAPKPEVAKVAEFTASVVEPAAVSAEDTFLQTSVASSLERLDTKGRLKVAAFAASLAKA